MTMCDNHGKIASNSVRHGRIYTEKYGLKSVAMGKPAFLHLSLSILSFVVANSSNVAQGAEMCYGQRVGSSLLWAIEGNWLDHNDTSQQLNQLPTEDDDVHIWASVLTGSPLVVGSGSFAQTKNFSVGHSKGAARKIFFEIQSGGTMTNAGNVIIGNDKDGTAGGIATLRSGGEWTANAGVTVGYSQSNRNSLMIETGAKMSATSGEFIVGERSGYFGVVTNRGELLLKDFFSGGSGVGTVVNEGTFNISGKLTIGRKSSGIGYFHQRAGAFVKSTLNQPIHVGYEGKGTFEVDTPLTLRSGEKLDLGYKGNGELIVNCGGSLTGLVEVLVGSVTNVAGACGTITLAGGEMSLFAEKYDSLLDLGGLYENGNQKTFGKIRGHGKIGNVNVGNYDARIRLRGQVVADGGDLDMGLIKAVGYGSEDNRCGTNGWYAVNGGRLIFPRRQDFSSKDHVNIGEYVYKGTRDGYESDISLVNSVQLRLYKNGVQVSDGKYNYAMLYAIDRTDIPGTIPCSSADGEKTLAVWRMGHFGDAGDVGAAPQNPVAFDEASLRFRYDSTGVDWSQHRVVLFHYDGTEWKRVGTASANDCNHVATASRQPSYDGTAAGDNWNIGWYAIVRKRIGGMIISFK